MAITDWSSIIALTAAGGIIIMLLIRPMKYSTIYEILKEKIINWRNDNFRIPELPNPNWVKVGTVEQLHVRPLASGYRINCPTLKFTPYGATCEYEPGFILRDKMFHIYDEKTNKFQNTHTETKIQIVQALIGYQSKVMFRADFSEIIIDLDEETKIRKVVRELITSWIIIRYIDCGEKIAKWLNDILRTSSLRVALIEYDIIDEPVIEEDMLRENKIDEAWEIFLSLTGYTAITLNTMGEFVCNTTHYLKIQPHIIVSAPKSPLFAEENWEWIRIGNIVMKKIMIVSNLTSVQESYKKNVCHHPPSFLGNFYRLFTVGTANLNDNVYVHVERTPNCPNFNLLI